jgi:predicted aspartyl protease/tetratricopeptide (TPR) repeat protein
VRRLATLTTVFIALSAAGGARAGCIVGAFAELPVTVTDLRPIATAKINGADVRFLVDSGAFYSQITAAKAAELGLKLGPAPLGLYVKGVGGFENVSVTTVKEFTIVGQPVKNVQFLVGGGEVGGDAVGYLGQNLLGLRDVEYDLAAGVVKLTKPVGCGGAPLVSWPTNRAFSVLPLITKDERLPLTRADVFINGTRIHAIFDTGAFNSTLSLGAARRAGIDVNGPGAISGGTIGGIGRKRSATWIVPVDMLKIGDGEEIHHTRLRVGEIALDDIDMLIGADFFLSHHIYVSNTQRKLYLTYNGGPVFDLTVKSATAAPLIEPSAAAAVPPPNAGGSPPATSPSGPDLKDAAGPAVRNAENLSRRGVAAASRHEFAEALDDLDHAVALAPRDARFLFERAGVHAENRQPLLALADVDGGLALDPANQEGLILRARLTLIGPGKERALADLDTVDRHAAPQADVRLAMGGLYMFAGAHVRALRQYDLWISAHPEDSRWPEALGQRCRVRAVMGQDLKLALADCDKALRLAPKLREVLESRGLVHLRQGANGMAITDFTAVLASDPNNARALYGRGLAERAAGLKDKGDADIAAATAIDPQAPAESRALGLEP